ncbi:MAG TPA: bifunctional demethylmenaquinone methyltransferase/2-methoxy-6-polyprenyl-1,4-benzoquinol methylase UbiE [Desulfobacterales bacterium]|jgi:demethylmenaquinone methyltransferase / 2-methoxy-6-polyprenyl-1,4-benzoquinol methylase|nr:bifunctional demethylmenaquinone methyltransferase/2-methoxy-6-polyprenyl-1,4-benzoquinol methylase UbiE [Desulfobacterales bacterium]
MPLKTSAWIDRRKRREKLAEKETAPPQAFFGYEAVPEVEKERRVRRHFDSVARHYDFMNTLLSFGIHHAWKRQSVRMMGLKPGDRVLDLCGGTGDLAILAAKRVGPAGRVVICDINWEMMAAGRGKVAASANGRRVCHTQGNAEDLPFADGSFEAAMVGYGIRNVTHPERGFQEMFRVLAPGGVMMCLEFSKPTDPVFRSLYDLYSFHIMPQLGELLAGSRQAYTHLPESIRTFPLPDELSEMLRGIGFARVGYRRQTNGISVVHVAHKAGGVP